MFIMSQVQDKGKFCIINRIQSHDLPVQPLSYSKCTLLEELG